MNSERFTRWQQRSIEQLGFAINLIMTLALSALGYTLAVYDKSNAASISRCTFVGACVLFLLAMLCGIIASLTRLYDFRLTAQTNREEDEIEKHLLRHATKRLGACTWFFLWAEVVAFAMGVCSATALIVSEKL